MNGAELLLETARKAGIEVCFTNFGTSEVPLALAFDSIPGIRPVLGLFEGVCTGAADGWGRVMGRPAMTLLHLGPGLGNGIANLHNAKRGRTPLINLVGGHTTEYRHVDSPLSMDIEAVASSVSGWYKTSTAARDLSRDLAEAYAASLYGQISTLIVPTDLQSQEIPGPEIAAPRFAYEPLEASNIEKAARLMRSHARVGLILGGRALRQAGLKTAARIRALTGCDLLINYSPGYIERSPGSAEVIQLPYFPEQQIEILNRFEAVVLAGASEPAPFFGYKGLTSHLLPESQPRAYLVTRRQNVVEALEQLAEALKGAPHQTPRAVKVVPPSVPRGELTADKACRALAALQPEGAIIVDESVSTGFPYYSLSQNSPAHTLINIAGGATGWGLPCSVGAAMASPGRTVIDFQADGCAMYTLQALWTQARQNLKITTLICSNRRYNILKLGFEREKASIGPQARSLIDLENPDLNWVKIASGLGVPAVSVTTVEGLALEFKKALAEPGPHLVEMVLQ